jgi:putative endonuclease
MVFTKRETTESVGDAGADRALAHPLRHGLVLVERHYRLAHGTRARGGEADRVRPESDGTPVFVELRARGAHATAARQPVSWPRSSAAPCSRHAMALRFAAALPGRFDSVAIDRERIQWLRAACDAA